MINTFFAGAFFQLAIGRKYQHGFAYETIRRTAPAAASAPSLFSFIIVFIVLTLWFITFTLNKLSKLLYEQLLYEQRIKDTSNSS